MKGIHLADTPIGNLPVPHSTDQELPPGSYWRALTRTTPERPLNVLLHPEDCRWFGGDSARHAQNLTGEVWGVCTPNGLYGLLSLHTVRYHPEDDTISVRPGDGSSNSILIHGRSPEHTYHGYIEHGKWRAC